MGDWRDLRNHTVKQMVQGYFQETTLMIGGVYFLIVMIYE